MSLNKSTGKNTTLKMCSSKPYLKSIMRDETLHLSVTALFIKPCIMLHSETLTLMSCQRKQHFFASSTLE